MPASWFTPEHLHAMLVHVPLVGLPLTLIPLITALVMKNRAMLAVSMVMAALTGWTIPVIMGTGEEAYERFGAGELSSLMDPTGKSIMHEHEERAEDVAWIVYVTASLAVLTLALMKWKPRWERPAAIAVAVGCLASTAALTWVADMGGQIRHPEFRPRTPAATAGPVSTPGAVQYHEDD